MGLVTHQWILLRYGLRDKIGGRVVSMHPAFEWQDETYASFWGTIVDRLKQAAEEGCDFFIWPGSPLDNVTSGQFPERQILALAAVFAFILTGWLVARRIDIPRTQAAYAIPLILVTCVLLIDLWILFWS